MDLKRFHQQAQLLLCFLHEISAKPSPSFAACHPLVVGDCDLLVLSDSGSSQSAELLSSWLCCWLDRTPSSESISMRLCSSEQPSPVPDWNRTFRWPPCFCDVGGFAYNESRSFSANGNIFLPPYAARM